MKFLKLEISLSLTIKGVTLMWEVVLKTKWFKQNKLNVMCYALQTEKSCKNKII